MSTPLRISRPFAQTTKSRFRQSQRHISRTSSTMAATLNSGNISKITNAEKKLTGSDNPVKDGPTANAQRHANDPINNQTLHDIMEGEKKVTGGETVHAGPTATAQSILAGGNAVNHETHTGKLDSSTISKITEAEKDISGFDQPVRAGPTAKAQSHASQPITSENLHDITEGEKKITGGERLQGGPTSTAQSELAKSRS